jgi:hypothetical protein
MPAFIGGHSTWSVVRPGRQPLIRVRGVLEPAVPVDAAWIVIEVRRARSGPASVLLRQKPKRSGAFTITFAPRRGSWGYRLAFVGRPKDRFSTSISDWHRYNR